MFTRGEFIEFVERVFGEGKTSNNGVNVSVVCPICAKTNQNLSKKKLVIETLTGVLHCWVCDYKSRNLFHILKLHRKEFLDEYTEKFWVEQHEESKNKPIRVALEQESKELALPEDFLLLGSVWTDRSNNSKDVNKAIRYLEERGLEEADAWRFKLGVTQDKDSEYQGRIIVPSFNSHGKLNFFTARSFVGHKKKYTNPDNPRESIVFNELEIDWREELLLTEGPFDLFKAPWNSTCLLGSTITPDYKLFQLISEHRTPVIFGLDPDVYKKTLRKAELLMSYGVPTKIIDTLPKDKDLGSLTKKQVLQHVADAKQVTPQWLFLERTKSI